MKIVVIGGTGLIGSKLVEKLRRAGHEPLAASPESGVDTYTGKGLEQALEEAQVVVDVSNAPGDNPRIAPTRFEDWLRKSAATQTNPTTQRRVS